MKTDGFNLADDHIPGEHVNEYLCDFANRFDVLKFVRFNTGVDVAADNGLAGWTLTVAKTFNNERTEMTIKASKLIVATGLTLEPFMPILHGRDIFHAPIYHTSEFARAESGLGSFKHVVLLSGAKFSRDIACAYASAGVAVD
ncbi:hypothetical protein M3J09_012624 [Ascochyta lentis]